jgi:hypothetical protein
MEKTQELLSELTDDQIQSVLTSIQQMFYATSDYKEGENAGKLNLL